MSPTLDNQHPADATFYGDPILADHLDTAPSPEQIRDAARTLEEMNLSGTISPVGTARRVLLMKHNGQTMIGRRIPEPTGPGLITRTEPEKYGPEVTYYRWTPYYD